MIDLTYLRVMEAFRDEHKLPQVRLAFLIRYGELLEQVGITKAAHLLLALTLSRAYEYEGWPPVKLLQLLLRDPEAAEAKYQRRKGLQA